MSKTSNRYDLMYVELPNLINRIILMDANKEGSPMTIDGIEKTIEEIKKVSNAALDGAYETLKKVNSKDYKLTIKISDRNADDLVIKKNKRWNSKGENCMNYEFMKTINAHQIQKEIDARMAQDAIRQKQIQDTKDKRDAAILITTFTVCVLVVGLLGG
jgi:hypothetical protein